SFPRLQQPLRVRERTCFLGSARSREEKTFGRDAFWRKLSSFNLGRIQPEGSSLCLDHVTNDQPFQFGESFAFQPAIGSPDRRVLPHDEQSLDFSVRHVEPVAERSEERRVGKELEN